MELNHALLAENWKRAMEQNVYDNVNDYLQDGHFDVDLLKQRTFECLLTTLESDVDEDSLLEALDNLIAESFYADLQRDANDLHRQGEHKSRNPMSYHGISQRDFLPPL